jgi:hypothetical protein
VRTQPPRDHREVEHQGRVGERQLGEVDDDVAVRAQGAEEGLPAKRLRGPVLVAGAAEQGLLLVEVDDAANLAPGAAGGKADSRISRQVHSLACQISPSTTSKRPSPT